MGKIFTPRGFSPTLFERLFDDEPYRIGETTALKHLSIDQLKDSVARDLEALLNSRRGLSDARLISFPLAQRSLLAYGVEDFVGFSLANPADCHRICKSIEETIAAHESRLKSVRVTLTPSENTTNSLHFTIHALLVVLPAREPVNFDALLQPSTQQYRISQMRKAPGL